MTKPTRPAAKKAPPPDQGEKLTPRQEAFFLTYARTGNVEASYREAGYAVENMSQRAIAVEASRVLANPKIQRQIAALRQQAAQAAQVTLESHLAELLWLREQSAARGLFSAAIAAEKARGEVTGLYIKRVAVSGGLEITEAVDLSKLSTDELRVMRDMLVKTGSTSTTALH